MLFLHLPLWPAPNMTRRKEREAITMAAAPTHELKFVEMNVFPRNPKKGFNKESPARRCDGIKDDPRVTAISLNGDWRSYSRDR